jgi:hypothetical protein
MNRLAAMILLAALFVGTVACEPSKEEAAATAASTQRAVDQAHGILAAGHQARSGGLAMTVLLSDDPFTPPNQFQQPIAGKRALRFKFRIENLDPKSEYEFFASDLKAIDVDGFQSESYFISLPEQQLQSETLAPGAKFEGWVVFQLDIGKPVARIEYKSFYSEDPSIVFTAQ